MEILPILEQAIEAGASDIFLIAGLPVTFKCHGRQQRQGTGRLLPDDIRLLADQIYQTSGRSRKNLEQSTDDDFSFSISHLGRFRVNVFRQRGSLAAVIRVIYFSLPDGKIHHPGLYDRPHQPQPGWAHHHHGGPHRVHPPA